MSLSPHHARAVPGNNSRAQKAKLHTKRRRRVLNELTGLRGLYESDNGLIFMVINTFIKHDRVGSTGCMAANIPDSVFLSTLMLQNRRPRY
jgi:hypothetical protein